MRIHLLGCLAALLLATPNGALAEQQDATANVPGSKTVESQQGELLRQAFAHEDAGNPRAAIAAYEKLLELDPKDVRAMNSIAGLNGKLGDFEAEVSWAERALAVNPGYQPAYINHGNGLMQLGRAKEGRASFEKAVQLEPADPVGHYSLGVLADQRGDFPAAIEAYRKAIEADPEFEPAHFNLAAAHANLGQFDEALSSLETVLRLNPRADDARAMRAAIERDRARRGN